jgi:hypothetical protein
MLNWGSSPDEYRQDGCQQAAQATRQPERQVHSSSVPGGMHAPGSVKEKSAPDRRVVSREQQSAYTIRIANYSGVQHIPEGSALQTRISQLPAWPLAAR